MTTAGGIRVGPDSGCGMRSLSGARPRVGRGGRRGRTRRSPVGMHVRRHGRGGRPPVRLLRLLLPVLRAGGAESHLAADAAVVTDHGARDVHGA